MPHELLMELDLAFLSEARLNHMYLISHPAGTMNHRNVGLKPLSCHISSAATGYIYGFLARR